MSHIIEQLETWGTDSLSPSEILEVQSLYWDRAQEILDYYSN
jgi:hypothetical protein